MKMNRSVGYKLLERNENFYSPVESSDHGDHKYDAQVIGIIGCGTIAKIITDFQKERNLDADLKYFQDSDTSKAQNLASQADGMFVQDVGDMLDEVDLVIEAVSTQIAVEIIPQILRKGKDIIVTSIDAFLDLEFKNQVKSIAFENNCRIYAPSGDIAGLDGVKAASIGEIAGINLLIRNSPESLGISSGDESLGIATDEEILLFEGKAQDAVGKFPINLDIAAVLSIITDREVDLKIIADPRVNHSYHEIRVTGDFGELETITQNTNWATDTKTSVLTAYSVIKLLENLNNNIKIGT
jgi:aspartate dehydrogenase